MSGTTFHFKVPDYRGAGRGRSVSMSPEDDAGAGTTVLNVDPSDPLGAPLVRLDAAVRAFDVEAPMKALDHVFELLVGFDLAATDGRHRLVQFAWVKGEHTLDGRACS
jgi:hypothetical protein